MENAWTSSSSLSRAILWKKWYEKSQDYDYKASYINNNVHLSFDKLYNESVSIWNTI